MTSYLIKFSSLADNEDSHKVLDEVYFKPDQTIHISYLMRRPTGDQDPRRGRQHSFVEIDHEIFSTVILPLPLIQEGQLSVSGERMCTILVNRLED